MPSVYEIVTERILAELERGEIPWRKPWRTEAPRNLQSGKAYRGINLFLLGLRGYASPWWLTFRQAKERGGNVRQGEHGTLVVFWKWLDRKVQDAETGETHNEHAPLLRYYTVFNVEQCDRIEAPASRAPVPAIEQADGIVQAMPNPPRFEAGDKAAYAPPSDTVIMPPRNSFDGSEDYYSTLFHELTHSTGHASRLARPGIMERHYFGSEDYSKEELVAEMGAAMTCGSVGIERTVANSAAYIQNWLKVLRGDSRIVVQAAAQAQKAADYILSAERGE